jgi:hypothetical protein
MSVKDEYLEYRLKQWADWFTRVGSNGLGYPSKTVEGRLIDEGGILIKGTGKRLPPSNSQAEEIEDYVRELANCYSELAQALKDKYFAYQNNSLDVLAKRRNVSTRTFKARVQMAKLWLAGRLDRRERNYISRRQLTGQPQCRVS